MKNGSVLKIANGSLGLADLAPDCDLDGDLETDGFGLLV